MRGLSTKSHGLKELRVGAHPCVPLGRRRCER
jgi:hypothetical protein